MIVAAPTPNHQTEFCFGLVMLLEAAEQFNTNIATPPRLNKARSVFVTSSISPHSKSNLVSYKSPSSKKRYWMNGVGKTLPVTVKKPRNLFYGCAWKQLDFGPASFGLNFDTVTNESTCVDNVETAVNSNSSHTIVLYDNEDDHNINAVHNIVRRDIWEGFVVDESNICLPCDEEKDATDARRCGRLSRYEGTVGFRCRFCKNQPPSQRADRSAVYPRSLDRIYHANIRFQRDHIEMCTFIPDEIKSAYMKLKDTKGLNRGRKSYWVSSASRMGLRDGEKGIVLSSGSK